MTQPNSIAFNNVMSLVAVWHQREDLLSTVTVDTGNICEVISICTCLHATTSKTSWWVGSLADKEASGQKMDRQLNIVHKLHG